MDEIQLNPDNIKEHYDALVGSAESAVTVTITVDGYSNINVKTDVGNAYSYANELERMVRTCIQTDAANLQALGVAFCEKDDNISDKINTMLE